MSSCPSTICWVVSFSTWMSVAFIQGQLAIHVDISFCIFHLVLLLHVLSYTQMPCSFVIWNLLMLKSINESPYFFFSMFGYFKPLHFQMNFIMILKSINESETKMFVDFCLLWLWVFIFNSFVPFLFFIILKLRGAYFSL